MAIIGKEVANCAFLDIERAFQPSAGFRVRREWSVAMHSRVAFTGAGQASRIRVSQQVCDFQIQSLSDYFNVLLMVCHELAHYLNRHNDHQDASDQDSKALETWADFYGMRLFMYLTTFRTRTRQALMDQFGEPKQDVYLKAIGRSLSEVYQEIYLGSPSDRYPAPHERVLIVAAGVLSFFRRLYGELKPTWSMYVLLTILREDNLLSRVGGHASDTSEHERIAALAMEIQTSLQGDERQITPGLKRLWEPLIGTGFGLTAEQVAANRAAISAETKKIAETFNLDRL